MASLSSNTQLITTLTCNDVILGRGQGPSQSPGNQQFLRFIRKQKSTYKNTNRQGKETIARALVDHIRDKLHGKFVKEIQNKDSEVRMWQEVTYAVALEKTKQALRERKNEIAADDDGEEKKSKGQTASEQHKREEKNIQEPNASEEEMSAALLSLYPGQSLSSAIPSLSSAQNLPATLPLPSSTYSVANLDPTLLQAVLLANPSLHAAALLQQSQDLLLPDVSAGLLGLSSMHTAPFSPPPSINIQAAYPSQLPPAEDVRILASDLLQQATSVCDQKIQAEQTTCHRKHSLEEDARHDSLSGINDSGRNIRVLSTAKGTSGREATDNKTEFHATGINSEKEVPDIEPAIQKFLKEVYEDEPNVPILTLEQEEKERACMTKEEQDATLADLFGDLCEITPRSSA